MSHDYIEKTWNALPKKIQEGLINFKLLRYGDDKSYSESAYESVNEVWDSMLLKSAGYITDDIKKESINNKIKQYSLNNTEYEAKPVKTIERDLQQRRNTDVDTDTVKSFISHKALLLTSRITKVLDRLYEVSDKSIDFSNFVKLAIKKTNFEFCNSLYENYINLLRDVLNQEAKGTLTDHYLLERGNKDGRDGFEKFLANTITSFDLNLPTTNTKQIDVTKLLSEKFNEK